MVAKHSGRTFVLALCLLAQACGGQDTALDQVATDAGEATEPDAAPADEEQQQDHGGYELGDSVDGAAAGGASSGSDASECDLDAITIKAVVRDFNGGDSEGGHPDFETFGGMDPTVGLVDTTLGADRKPVYTGLCSEPGMTESCPNAQQMTTEKNFNQWYRNVSGVNQAFEVILTPEPSAETLTFEAGEFFPLDGAAFGNEGRDHNYHFTTEVHMEFEYLGGEVFTFVGDDDVWIFINGQLAVDLGGLHGEATGVVDLDAMAAELGITLGSTYGFDLFHAERHTTNSRFRIATNLKFTNCGVLVPDAI